MKALAVSALVLFLFQVPAPRAAELPAVIHYDLDVRFALKEQRVKIVAAMTIRNDTDEPCRELPFLLYRLFAVEKVCTDAGAPLPFRQDIVQLSDEPTLQARRVLVTLPVALRPRDSLKMTVTYEGFMFGYPEVMAYVRDTIDEDYSLLRPDAFAFPILADATFASQLAANDTKFTYGIAATVPKDYTAVCGGEFISLQTKLDKATYLYRSKIPTWRIDLAVARFSVLGSPADKLTVYHLPDDRSGAELVLGAARNAIGLFGKMFGQPKNFKGYAIIEIPNGWGSQASDFYFLQTAAAFKDKSRLNEVYHEIAHSWNATPAPEIQRCRWFDEAFASFFESLAIGKFNDEKSFAADMEKARDLFVQWANYDRQVFDTPIAGYGKKEMGRHSYTKGAWSLYVLYSLIGEKDFDSIIRAMLSEFADRTMNFGEFQALCQRISKRDLTKFFQEWIYGTESSGLLVGKVPIAEIVRRYPAGN